MLVFDDAAGGPRTHAIVIGIGAYPHLLGGTPGDARDTFGLKQLSSPPVSALCFANWLLTEFENPTAGLGSLELLISMGDTPVDYKNPRTGTEHRLALPTKAAIKTAVRAWKQRADTHPDNITVFYFCGHGLARGEEVALLARDFGDPGATTLENAIDFDALRLGMEACTARRQCYFIDACRNEPQRLQGLKTMGDNQILDPDLSIIHARDRDYPVFYATARDHQAHAIPGGVSRFTEALLCALRGAGSDDPDGTWVVDTLSLSKGICGSLALGNRRRGVPQQRAKAGGNDAGFKLHHIRGEPHVPVMIGCQPPHGNALARLSIAGRAGSTDYEPDAEGWQVQLLADRYALAVHFPGRQFRDANDELQVRPPYRCKKIGVQP